MASRDPNRVVGALLAFVAPPGVGHAYLGLPVRGAVWLGACTLVGIGVPAALPAIYGAGGGTVALVVLIATLALPWLGPLVDVLVLPRKRFGEPRMSALIVMLCVGVVIALVTLVGRRVFLIEAFKIPAGSMMPTLLVGDHIFVDKAVYRARPPRYGEVMVFAFPEHPEQDFIKRVAALPGDRLEVKNGRPIVNGWEVPHCKVGKWSYVDSFEPSVHHEGDMEVEFLGELAYLTFYDAASGAFPEYQGPYDAKPGEYWVMGDNRNNSHDSRMWYGGRGGGVPRDHVRGHALVVWMSIDPAGVERHRTGLSVERPTLPSGAESLQPALDACLKSRPAPAQATPPPAMR
jgi:signal peptidase I